MEFSIGRLVKYNQATRPDLNLGAGLIIGLKEQQVLVYWPVRSECLWTDKEQLQPHGKTEI